ncbi:hypothetical protein [Endozoicomonas sp.]|uniref:hypothetical protein n=1 Tax=Endozoicomonas sp. TaxID=1892382 RepID=UPI003D9ACF1A
MHFSFLLFCGGICYHILTEILSTPVTEENRDEWPKLLKLLSYLMISLMSIPAVILLLRDSFNSEWAMPTAFVYLLTYLYLSVVLFIQVGRKFLEIRQSLLSGEKNMPLEEHIKKTRERARKSAKQLLKPLCRDIQEELKKETTLGNPENLIKPDNRDE